MRGIWATCWIDMYVWGYVDEARGGEVWLGGGVSEAYGGSVSV